MRSDAGPWQNAVASSSRRTSPDTLTEKAAFTVSISPRAKLLVGWEVRPSFSVSQNGDRAEVLHAIQAYFGCGSIRPDRSDKTVKWETRRLEDHPRTVIVPHFEQYPAAVRKAVRLRALRVHLPADGGRRGIELAAV